MNEKPSIAITAADGEQQICILKEKVNNENGQLIYRFHNQHCGEDYLIARDGNRWNALNNRKLPENNINELTDFAEGLES